MERCLLMHISLKSLLLVGLFATTHHETKRAGVDIGVIHTAVHFIGAVPVCWALVFMAEASRFRCISTSKRKETNDWK